MPNMNQREAMVVNPVLTNIALGYTNAEFVGQRLFPRVPVGASTGKILKFNRERWRRLDTQRAPGAQVATVEPRYGSGDYAAKRHDLDGKLPVELQNDAENGVPGIDLGGMTIQETRGILEFQLEIEQADVARNASLYPSTNKEVLAGSARWTQSGSTPLEDIRDAREAIRAKTGRYPNVMVLSARAKSAIVFHAAFIDRVKYSVGGVVNDQLIAALTEIPNIYTAADQIESEDAVISDLWGSDVILAYVPQTVTSMAMPSYGYTYTVRGYPAAYNPYWKSEVRSWMYPFSDWRAPVLTGMDAGFLFQNAGDAS